MPGEFLVFLIVSQRIVELFWAERNTRRLLAQGAVEHGAGHYPMIVALHVAWLAVVAIVSVGQSVPAGWVLAYLALQILRIWTIATLGYRWTTRVIIPRASTAIDRGPFRLMRHPNYTIVVLELAMVPLALGAPMVALVFTVLNAAIMAFRIPCEEKALRS